jgi:hypothetical protein
MAQLTMSLDRFTVVKRRDVVGKDEPYLWVYGIVIHASSAPDPERSFIIELSGAPGNLGGGMDKGDTRDIPDGTGRIDMEVTPIAGRLLVAGLVAIAWEHDHTPVVTCQNAYRQTGKLIDDFIINFIPAMLAEGEIRDPNAAELKKLQADVEGRIRTLFKGTVRTGLPWTLNQDDFIGENDFTARIDGEQSFQQALDWTFTARGTEYRVTGELRYRPDAAKGAFGKVVERFRGG